LVPLLCRKPFTPTGRSHPIPPGKPVIHSHDGGTEKNKTTLLTEVWRPWKFNRRQGIDVLSVAGPRESILSRSGSSGNTGGPKCAGGHGRILPPFQECAFSVCGQIVASRIIDLVGIKCPIIQAPWAGEAKADLAASVSEAGGLGSLNSGRLNLRPMTYAGADVALGQRPN
jgi:hypothetical protein